MSGYALYKVSGKGSILVRRTILFGLFWYLVYDIDRNEIIIVIQGVPYG